MKQTALVDTEATYVTVRSDLAEALELMEIRAENLSGFGSTKPFEVKISRAKVEINGFEAEVEIAVVDRSQYPERAPIAIIGRNFLNQFRIELKNRTITLG